MRQLARAVERSDVTAAEFLIAGSSLQFLTADAAGTLRVYGGYEQQSTVMHPLCDAFSQSHRYMPSEPQCGVACCCACWTGIWHTSCRLPLSIASIAVRQL